MHNMGMTTFNFDKFQEYNNAEDTDDSTHIRLVKYSILRIMKSMYIKYKDICMDTFVEVWYDECKYTEYPPTLQKLSRATKFVDSFV